MAFKHYWVQYKLAGESKQSYIKADSFVIGRAMECELPVACNSMSRQHLMISRKGQKIFVEDLGSTNGTFLKNERLVEKVPYEYKNGDKIYIDAKKDCIIKIIAIFEQDEFELENLPSEPQDSSYKLQTSAYVKKSQQQNEGSSPDFVGDSLLSQAGETVENAVDDFLFVLKNARFNREKKIREAEKHAQRMVDQAKLEIDQYRKMLEDEILTFQAEVEKQAQTNLTRARKDGKKIIEEAKKEAQNIRDQISDEERSFQSGLEQRKAQALLQTQEQHKKIISEAGETNEKLKQENFHLVAAIEKAKIEIESYKNKSQQMHEEAKQFEQLQEKAERDCKKVLDQLEDLNSQVKALEDRNEVAKKDLNKEIPLLETKRSRLEETLVKIQENLSEKQAEISIIEKDIHSRQQDVADWQEKSLKAENRLDELSEKINVAENHLLEMANERKQRKEEIETEVAERKLKIRLLEDEAVQDIELKQQEFEEQCSEKEKALNIEREQLLAQAQKEADKIRNDAEHYANELKGEIDQRRSDAEQEVTKALKDLDEECQSIRSEAKSQAAKTRRSAKKYSERVSGEADKYAQGVRDSADAELAALKDSIERETRKICDVEIGAAKKKAQEIVAQSQEESQSLINATRIDLEKQEKKAHRQIEKQQQAAQKEINRLKKDCESEVDQMRKTTLRSLETKKKNFETELLERDRIRSQKLRAELHKVLRVRLSPFVKNGDGLVKMEEIITNSINAIILDEIELDSFLSESVKDIDPAGQQRKVKKFWLASGFGLVTFVSLLFVMPKMGEVAKDSGRKLAQASEKETNKKIAKVKKQKDLSAKFNPEQTDQYKSSYTDRVLYTKDYVATELDKGFREEWILALQDYFVHDLRLNENNLVPFIAQEASLIRELEEARKKINGNFSKEGISRMREIEQSFVDKLKKHIKKKSNYKKIMKFKKNYYLKNRAN